MKYDHFSMQNLLWYVASYYAIPSTQQCVILFLNILEINRKDVIIQYSVQVHALFESEFSTECDLMLPLSISRIFSFP